MKKFLLLIALTSIMFPAGAVKKMLLEEFTTAVCPNCPPAAELVDIILEWEGYDNRVVAVAHHAGYYTDAYTIPADEEYLWFYGSRMGIYAPAFMYDRTRATYDNAPVFFPGNASVAYDPIPVQLNSPELVTFTIDAQVTDNGVEVKVDGKKLPGFDAQKPHITVTITEDKIFGVQSGAGNFTFNHVGRCVNSTWGEPLTFSGDDFSYSCVLPTDNISNIRNINVVAFVHNYNSLNKNDCEVYNVDILPYNDFGTTGVSSAIADEDATPEYYDLNGVRVANPEKGQLYIVRRGTSAQKVIF